MDEEAKRVYMLLPEAIEIETAYMSCTQAVESCNGVIGELKTPISPEAEQIPISEKPKPYNGKSFDDMMPHIAMICYVANIIALILLMCLDVDGDMGYRILIGALSPLWPVLAVLSLLFAGSEGAAFFALCLLIPAIICICAGTYSGHKRRVFEKSERNRVEKINADSIKQAELINKKNQRLADEANESREKALVVFHEEYIGLKENLHKVEGLREEMRAKLDLPKYFQSLNAMCGINVLLDKRRALTLEGPDGAYTQFDRDQSLARIENKIDAVSSQISGLSDAVRAGMSRISSDLCHLEWALDGIRDLSAHNAQSLALKLDDNTKTLKGIGDQMQQQIEISNGVKALAEYNAKVSNYELGWTSVKPSVRYR